MATASRAVALKTETRPVPTGRVPTNHVSNDVTGDSAAAAERQAGRIRNLHWHRPRGFVAPALNDQTRAAVDFLDRPGGLTPDTMRDFACRFSGIRDEDLDAVLTEMVRRERIEAAWAGARA